MNETIYEDRLAKVLLAPDPAANGHLLVLPQRQVVRLSELSEEESAHLFLVASYTAAILFQGLQAEGTNIIINEEEPRLTAHVIARRSEDGLELRWEPRKLPENEMKEVEERLKEQAFRIGKGGKEPEQPQEPKAKREVLREAEDEENYLIKQLIKVP